MDTNMTFRMDSQSKARMTEICAQLGMTTSVRANGMSFTIKSDAPSPMVTRSQMLADADDILSDFAEEYKRMAE